MKASGSFFFFFQVNLCYWVFTRGIFWWGHASLPSTHFLDFQELNCWLTSIVSLPQTKCLFDFLVFELTFVVSLPRHSLMQFGYMCGSNLVTCLQRFGYKCQIFHFLLLYLLSLFDLWFYKKFPLSHFQVFSSLKALLVTISWLISPVVPLEEIHLTIVCLIFGFLSVVFT